MHKSASTVAISRLLKAYQLSTAESKLWQWLSETSERYNVCKSTTVGKTYNLVSLHAYCAYLSVLGSTYSAS